MARKENFGILGGGAMVLCGGWRSKKMIGA
jgi:hypothetical protein